MSISTEGEATQFRDSEAHNNLQTILQSCPKLAEVEDSDESENTISKLVSFLDSLLDATLSDPDDEHKEKNAFEALSEIHGYICSPSLDQEVVDALSFELPKAVSKFAGISRKILDMAISIIDQFIVKCGPRDMLSILCDTLGYSSKVTSTASYIVPPLSGLSKVLISIRRRQFQQVKEAVPIILNVLKAVCLESDEEELDNVFDRAIEIANSIYEVCNKLVDNDAREKLRALLGLYVLQCLALVSASDTTSGCHALVLQLSRISSYCDLSYLSLVTTYDVEAVASTVFGENKDDCMDCLSHVKHGAALSVVWGHVSEEVAHAAKEDIIAVKDELRKYQIKRWHAVGTLKHALSFASLPWELKKHTINFLLCITDGDICGNCNDEHSKWPSYLPNIFSALQAVTMVIMYAPDPELRKNSFAVLKGIAILLDLVRRELHTENHSSVVKGVQQINHKGHPDISFWSPSVLELVESVLRPPQGGPPSLPEQSDAVLSALNLYRFVLMTESTGKTNYTGVLSRSSLLKVFNEWLLPLRTLVTGIMAENKSDYDELSVDTVCTLNPLELVLYRCIELVEEKLKQVK
ncbi:hypothetical protein TSUD_264240 [Trifolium subterraneum]|uniref:Aberrant root formation protein 4 n=1 Tax=Trifolium subterraneum TaxID=3900 RepID=A0A2Z6MD40_TRISU|nr:hypothetical protein TSUD_264240 [Trifolium subterraneum]